MTYHRIGVVGAGAWGAALAKVAMSAGRRVAVFARHPGVDALPIDHESVAEQDAVLLVVPAQAVREVAALLAPRLDRGVPVVVCAKGIEQASRQFMTEVVAGAIPQAAPAILSGPSFAADVAAGLPTAVTLAARAETIARDLALALGSPAFRPYHSTDVRGVEIGGAAKNVLAIAAGIVAGRGLGASASAATITRGFAELLRFGRAHGAQMETLTGLSGLGDLVLTCSSPQSRNFSYGVALGQGHAPMPGGKLAEGVFTAPALVEMARGKHIEMPIAGAVADVLAGRITVDDAIGGLLNRPFRAET